MLAKKSKFMTCILAFVLTFSLAGCGNPLAVDLTGAGSSFVYPLLSQQIEEYRKTNPEVMINYQSSGSGAGITQLSEGTIDLGASDSPMSDELLKYAKSGEIIQIPLTLGAIAVAYNLPADLQDLRLSSEVLADIFLGRITKWNDQRIAADNPYKELPDLEIVVARRSDGSGTTYIFTEYLSAVSPTWLARVGGGTSVNWPVGVGSKGNSGVAATLQQTAGSIGYLEFAYAVKNNLACAVLQNRDGNWVAPSLEGVSAAAASADIPEDMRVSLVDAPGADSYPIAGFTWALLYKEQKDKTKGEALVKFLNWSIHEGQALAEDLYYAKLPEDLVAREEAILRTVTSEGRPLLP